VFGFKKKKDDVTEQDNSTASESAPDDESIPEAGYIPGETAELPPEDGLLESTQQPEAGTEQAKSEDSTGSLKLPDEEDPQICALKQELAETKDKYLRALAELENYKKRALKDRSDLLRYQGEPVLYDMLAILDNLELALQNAQSDPAKIMGGVKLIHKMFVDTFSKWEVRPESALGKDFDPQTHHALSRVAVDNSKPGSVIAEPKKAYFYKDKLLRAGEAVVAAERPKEEPKEEEVAEDAPEAEE
jgi:molecular chaperone GrpE